MLHFKTAAVAQQCVCSPSAPVTTGQVKRVASSVVEHSAFNRLVLGSNPRRPIFSKRNAPLALGWGAFLVFIFSLKNFRKKKNRACTQKNPSAKIHGDQALRFSTARHMKAQPLGKQIFICKGFDILLKVIRTYTYRNFR